MNDFKKILSLSSILRQFNYEKNQPMIVIINTSLITIGWTIKQEDSNNKIHAI